jgi:DNA invertase Pin-like site-specific DNA recombinase
MRKIPKTPTIEQEGLQKWLDRRKHEHNDKGYDDLIEMLESELNYSKTQIALAFGVHRDTIYNWLAIHEKEQGNGTRQQEP